MLDEDIGWEQIVLTSGKLKGHPHYYNCKFADGTKGSIQLLPGRSKLVRLHKLTIKVFILPNKFISLTESIWISPRMERS